MSRERDSSPSRCRSAAEAGARKPQKSDDLLTATEAAHLAGISTSMVYYLVRRNRLPVAAVLDGRGTMLIPRASLHRWMDRQ